MSGFTRLGLLAALPLAIAAVSALAQSNDTAPASGATSKFFEHMIKKMDTNGDGRISLDEYLAAATTHFRAIDTQNKGSVDAAQIATSPNAIKRMDRRATALVKHLDTAGNGYVTQSEFLDAAKKRFARLDKKGDGALTADELAPPRWAHRDGANADKANGKFAQFEQKRFAALDTNHDGVVTLTEYLAYASADYQTLDAAHNGKVTASEIASSPKAQERAAHVAAGLVKHLDTNGDGVVSQDEFIAAAQKRFAHIDKNGDGFIDANEITSHRWAHANKPARNDG
jgi:Ca2+-binding EF-hand superfamily protein